MPRVGLVYINREVSLEDAPTISVQLSSTSKSAALLKELARAIPDAQCYSYQLYCLRAGTQELQQIGRTGVLSSTVYIKAVALPDPIPSDSPKDMRVCSICSGALPGPAPALKRDNKQRRSSHVQVSCIWELQGILGRMMEKLKAKRQRAHQISNALLDPVKEPLLHNRN